MHGPIRRFRRDRLPWPRHWPRPPRRGGRWRGLIRLSSQSRQSARFDDEAVGNERIAALLPPSNRFKLLTFNDLNALPPPQWLVRGVLPSSGIGAIFGPSGSGKSFLTLDLLAAVARGSEWFDHRVKTARVLYVGLEGEAGIQQRATAFSIEHGPASAMRYQLTPLDIRKPNDRTDLISAVRDAGWEGGVICIDTLNRAAPGMDENDSQHMGEVISAAKALQAALGGLILMVHHTGKDSSKGLRGHSSLLAALDCAIEVSRDGDHRSWRVYKSKDGEDGKAHPFSLQVVDLGKDHDGEQLTSCVVSPEVGGTVRRSALPPKSGNQKLIWDALLEMLATADSHPEGAPTEAPFGQGAIRLDDAIEKTRTRLTCESKRQTERAHAAITGLVARGILVHQDGWLWRPLYSPPPNPLFFPARSRSLRLLRDRGIAWAFPFRDISGHFGKHPLHLHMEWITIPNSFAEYLVISTRIFLRAH